jgi:SMC interacting uncharacterized protein involved in chromosome segregation
VKFLVENMRLTSLQAQQNPTEEEQNQIHNQLAYENILAAVGEHIFDASIENGPVKMVMETTSPSEITATLAFNTINFVHKTVDGIQDVINFLYPDGLPKEQDYHGDAAMPSKCILSFTNELVDEWNTRIQELNENTLETLKSSDVFAEIDDDKGYLKANLTEAVKNDFTNTEVPPHTLKLKVGDICLITRNLHALNLPSNSKVRIKQIHTFSISITTMETIPRDLRLPRIKFKFHLK